MPNTIPMGATEQTQRGRPHIFVVNGAPDFLNLMRELLQDEDYNVTTTNFVPLTFDQIATARPDVLIVDLVVGQRAGWDLLEALHADAATAEIPVITVSTDPAYLTRAQDLAARYGTAALLQKPFDLDDMLALVAAALGRG
jgi:DNA-binding response OmpR family regulator